MRLPVRVMFRTVPSISCLAVAFFASLSMVPVTTEAQGADSAVRSEVLRTVDRFFLAMTRRDSAEARRVLVTAGGFYTVRAAGGDSVPPRRTNSDFVAMLSKPGQLLQERIWNPTVHIDGAIALVWAPYDFHVDGKFSHCGTDAFSLIRTSDGWKIAEIVYTVQQTGCAPSPLGAIK